MIRILSDADDLLLRETKVSRYEPRYNPTYAISDATVGLTVGESMTSETTVGWKVGHPKQQLVEKWENPYHNIFLGIYIKNLSPNVLNLSPNLIFDTIIESKLSTKLW